MKNKICKHCKKQYSGQGKLYCSRSCAAFDRPVSYFGSKHWNWKGGKIKKICRTCGKEFFVSLYQKDKAVICSNKCFVASDATRKKMSERKIEFYKTSRGKKLKNHLSNLLLNQKNINFFKSGIEHPNFKGKNSTVYVKDYKDIHRWLNINFGKADRCENIKCNNANPKMFEWSLIHNKKYEKNRENFWKLCRKCHKKYDYGF
jgi:hypothetical protein